MVVGRMRKKELLNQGHGGERFTSDKKYRAMMVPIKGTGAKAPDVPG